MTACQETEGDIGGYSQATIVYSALVAGSLVKRTGLAVARGAVCTTQAAARAARYSAASVEYAGLKSASLVVRGVSATGSCAARALAPVGRSVARPFGALGRGTACLFRRTPAAAPPPDPAVAQLAQRVSHLEDRLAELERFGVRPAAAVNEPRAGAEVDDARRAVLRAIMVENKLIRSAG